MECFDCLSIRIVISNLVWNFLEILLTQSNDITNYWHHSKRLCILKININNVLIISFISINYIEKKKEEKNKLTLFCLRYVWLGATQLRLYYSTCLNKTTRTDTMSIRFCFKNNFLQTIKIRTIALLIVNHTVFQLCKCVDVNEKP